MAHYICLAEDLSSIPRIHIGWLTAPSTSGSWRYSALLGSPRALHRHTGTDRLLKKKIDVRNNKGYSNLIGMHLRFSQDCPSFGHRVETQSSSISRLPYPVYDPHPKGLLIAGSCDQCFRLPGHERVQLPLQSVPSEESLQEFPSGCFSWSRHLVTWPYQSTKEIRKQRCVVLQLGPLQHLLKSGLCY